MKLYKNIFLLFYILLLTNSLFSMESDPHKPLNLTNNKTSEEKLHDILNLIDYKEKCAIGKILDTNESPKISNFDNNDDYHQNLLTPQEPPLYKCNGSPTEEILRLFPLGFPRELMTAMQCFENPQRFIKANKQVPNKFLLFGKPGTGKSFFVEQIHKIFQLPFIYLKAGDLENEFYGRSSKMITQILNTRDKNGRVTLVFVDEVDGISLQRDKRTSRPARATLTSLLSELQKNSGNPLLCVFVATNDKDSLDKAFLDRFNQNIIEFKSMSNEEHIKLVQRTFENLPIQDKLQATKTFIAASKGINRRNITEAINTADACVFSEQGENYILTIHDLLHFVNRNKKNSHEHFGKRAINFAHYSLPYISLIHGIIGSAGNLTQLALNVTQFAIHMIDRNQNKIQSLQNKRHQRTLEIYDRELQLEVLDQTVDTNKASGKMRPVLYEIKKNENITYEEAASAIKPSSNSCTII